METLTTLRIPYFGQVLRSPSLPTDMTNRLHLMNAAIECNNVAVALMREGDHVRALETFKWATQLLFPVSQAIRDPLCSPLNPTISPITASAAVIVGMTTVDEAKKQLPGLSCDLHIPRETFHATSPDGYTSMHAVTLDLVTEASITCTYEAATILFNMGVAYYQYNETSCAKKALCLFEMAFSLAQIIAVDDHRAHPIAMASLNNSAYIYHSWGHYQLARYSFDLLAVFINRLPPTNDESLLNERHEYLLNVVLLQIPTAAAAA